MRKQEKYAQKMIGKGFINVRSWIPAEKTEELKTITKAWREEKAAREMDKEGFASINARFSDEQIKEIAAATEAIIGKSLGDK